MQASTNLGMVKEGSEVTEGSSWCPDGGGPVLKPWSPDFSTSSTSFLISSIHIKSQKPALSHQKIYLYLDISISGPYIWTGHIYSTPAGSRINHHSTYVY